MKRTNHGDGGESVQGSYRLESFPFDDPEIAQAIAHAIALLLRNDAAPCPPCSVPSEGDKTRSTRRPKKRPVSRD